ncbi:MAG: methyltransferase domain-containing protein [Pseudomonadota bacterium]
MGEVPEAEAPDEGLDEAATERLAELYEGGLAAERAGDLAAAAAAFHEVLRINPDDHGGVAIRLAAIGHGPAPQKAPAAYIATLFDQHAEAFDEILVEKLGYDVPALAAEALRRLAPGPYRSMLDLGCGTGLAGIAMANSAQRITGVDLSEEMLALCDEREVYDQLFIGDVVQFLEEEEESHDLIVATDVLPYLGDLAPFFAAASACLASGGVIALSSESCEAGTWTVGRKHRFAHAPEYLTQLLSENGLFPLCLDPITVRMEEGAPVPGHLILAQCSA